MPLLLWLFSMLPSVTLKVDGFFWNFFLYPLATLHTIAYMRIMCVLGECDHSLHNTQ